MIIKYLFSVIIPVYNVENYLEQCLNSVLGQTFKNIEVILINDGTNDDSGSICEVYKKKYVNVKYIVQENQGLASARNNALKQATGQYVVFVDSDDYLSYDKAFEEIELLISKFNYPDIILHEESRLFSEEDIVYKNNKERLNTTHGFFQNEMEHLVYNRLFVASAWDKIIKREILIKQGISFPKGYKSEDMIWVSDLIPHINTFCVYDKSFYMYRQSRIGSISNSVNEKHLLDIFNMITMGLKKVKELPEIYKQTIENYWAEHYVFLLMNYYILSKETREKMNIQIKEWEYLIKEGATLNVDKVVKAYKWTSLSVLIMLLNNFRYFNKWNKNVRLIK